MMNFARISVGEACNRKDALSWLAKRKTVAITKSAHLSASNISGCCSQDTIQDLERHSPKTMLLQTGCAQLCRTERSRRSVSCEAPHYSAHEERPLHEAQIGSFWKEGCPGWTIQVCRNLVSTVCETTYQDYTPEAVLDNSTESQIKSLCQLTIGIRQTICGALLWTKPMTFTKLAWHSRLCRGLV